MKGLSKSRYTAFCQCPKNLWLNVNKPNEAFIDDALKARFAQGNDIGDLAMGLFGPYKEVNETRRGQHLRGLLRSRRPLLRCRYPALATTSSKPCS